MNNISNIIEEMFVSKFVETGTAEWFRIVPAVYCSRPVTLITDQINFATLKPLVLSSPIVINNTNRVDQVFNDKETARMLLAAKVKQSVVLVWLN